MYAIVTEDEEDEVASGTIAALEAIGIARDVGIQIRCRGDRDFFGVSTAEQ